MQANRQKGQIRQGRKRRLKVFADWAKTLVSMKGAFWIMKLFYISFISTLDRSCSFFGALDDDNDIQLWLSDTWQWYVGTKDFQLFIHSNWILFFILPFQKFGIINLKWIVSRKKDIISKDYQLICDYSNWLLISFDKI